MSVTVQVRTAIEDIKSVRERVVHIYSRYPDAVNSDRRLEELYHQLFAPNLSPLSLPLPTIRRNGRDLRKKFPERFKRKAEVEEQARVKEEAFRHVFTPTY